LGIGSGSGWIGLDDKFDAAFIPGNASLSPLVYFITLGRKTKNTGVVSLIGNEGSFENARMILFDKLIVRLFLGDFFELLTPICGNFQSQNCICVKYVGRGQETPALR